MTLREFHNTLKSIDLQPLKEMAVIENKDRIVQANREQMREGKTNEGNMIEPYYSELYLKRKQKMSSYGAPTGVPDLYLTGDFQSEMDVAVEDGQYIIFSWDPKMAFLPKGFESDSAGANWGSKRVWSNKGRYENIFGLTDDNKELIQKFVTESFMRLVRNRLSN